ncbi:MAG TPA: hypothetical protein VEY69_04665, partial [Lautropia sp.]|nr:hypothetical protein [Lautropia sp.]
MPDVAWSCAALARSDRAVGATQSIPACGGSRHGDGHAAVGDVAVVVLSFNIGRTHWAVIGVSAWCRARRGAAGQQHRERHPVAGPSDPPSFIT